MYAYVCTYCICIYVYPYVTSICNIKFNVLFMFFMFVYVLASKRRKLCTVVDKHFQKMLELKEQSRQDRKAHHELTMRRLDTLNDILKTIIDKEAKK